MTASPIPGQGGGFVPAIQGLRGFAALTVLATHLYAMPYLAGIVPVNFPAWLHDALVTGGHGVELFFIISGFLIPASLVRHGTLSKFFYDRAMRIMPLFVLLHLTLFVAGPLAGYKFFRGMDAVTYARVFLSNLFFVPDLFGDPIGQQNAWTLTYEWVFYLWFALAFVAFVQGWRPVVALFVGLGTLLCWLYPSALYFGLGMLLAARPVRLRLPRAIGLVLAFLAMGMLYYFCQYATPYLGIPAGLVIFVLVLTPASGFADFLNTAPLQFLGRISYSLYLLHPFALFPLMLVAQRATARGIDPWLVLCGFAIAGTFLSVAASAVSYEVVEVRLRRRLHDIFKGRAAGNAPARGV